MVKRTNLRSSWERDLAEIVADLRAKEEEHSTSDHGIKDMGETGNSVWTRPDGTVHTIRDVDAELEASKSRIEEAREGLAVTQERLEAAETGVEAASERLDTVENVTLPNAVQALQDADAEAQQTLIELESRLEGVGTGTSTELTEIREQLQDALQAVQAAQATADDAVTAANSANQAALQAAGIAGAKGEVLYTEEPPTPEQQKSSNLWIKPSTEQTFVWSESAGSWEEITSDLLDQAAQNAIDAQNTANQAKQTAETAIANASTAQAAAESAQRTADSATISARDAHNEAVAAADVAAGIRADLAHGPSLWEDPSFERGRGGVPALAAGRIERSQDWSASGSWSIKYIANGGGGNNYGVYGFVPASPGRWYMVTITVHADEHEQCINTTWDARDVGNNTGINLGWMIQLGETTVQPGETRTQTWFFRAPEGTKFLRYWIGQHSHANTAEKAGQVVYLDDFRLVDVTDSYPQYLAAQQAAGTAAQAAEEARQLAESKPDMDDVQQAITVSANGKTTITVSATAPVSSSPGAVVGDTWWQADAAGNIFGQWSWDGGKWQPHTIKSEVIANLDVGKLTVTGTSRFTEAVVDRLFVDIFAAHKITANELTISSIASDGSLAPGSVQAVTIKDGAVNTPHLNVTQTMAAKIAQFMDVETKRLVVTEDAVLQHSTLLGQTVVDDINIQGKLIGQDGVFTGTVDFDRINVTGELLAETIMSSKGLIAGTPGGKSLELNEAGLTLWEVGEDGTQVESVYLGPRGENLLTMGNTTVSPYGVQALSGSFDELTLGGQTLDEVLAPLPRGVVAWGQITQPSTYDGSNKPQRRAEIQCYLEPNRLYEVSLSAHYLEQSYTAATAATEYLHYSLDGTPIFPESPGSGVVQGMSAIHYLTTGRAYTVPGTSFVLDTSGWSGRRTFWCMFSIASMSSAAPVRLVAGPTLPLTMAVEDLGPAMAGTLKRWNDNNSGGSQDTTPVVQRYTKTYNSTGYRTFNADGSDAGRPDVVHGSYAGAPSNYNRRGGWTFPSMTGDLSGATVEKVEMYMYCTHTYSSAGSTINPAVWGSVMANSLTTFTSISGWKANSGRWITLPSNLYAGFKSGQYAGVGVRPTSTSTSQYARFSPTGAKIRITYRK